MKADRVERRGAGSRAVETVDVVLAAYNGERFIAEQLDSIANQTYEHWHLLVRDDGSTDETLQIVRAFAARHPGRVTVIEEGNPTGSAKRNFARLLEHSTAAYVAFCDQDDVWLPQRLEASLAAVRALEDEAGAGLPVLVHSDLIVIDEAGKVLSPSLWSYQNLDGNWPSHFGHALAQNVVTGCATTINRALLDLATPVPPEAVMHDWWLAVVASAFGRVQALDEATVQYRQHGRNEVGAKRFGFRYARDFTTRLLKSDARAKVLHLCAQADAFVRRYPDAAAARTARALAELPCQRSWLRRKRILIAHRFWKIGLLRNVAWFLLA